MRRVLPTLFALALSPALCHAAVYFDRVNVACTQSLTVNQGDALSLSCMGDLTLSGEDSTASLTAAQSITLTATGDVQLARLNLVSPLIDIRTTEGRISIADDVQLFSQPGGGRAPDLTLQAGGSQTRPPLFESASGSLFVRSGDDATLTWALPTTGAVSLVPEPGMGLLCGVGVLGLLARRRLPGSTR